ncbi:MAG: hypothetical protein ACMUEM_01160 [Flavobacteriales bacterium AspAUS03]
MGWSNILITRTDGNPYSWGNNKGKQLGDGTTENKIILKKNTTTSRYKSYTSRCRRFQLHML